MFFGNHYLVYPNPFENQFFVYDGMEGEDVTVKVYSAFGQLVLSKKIKNKGAEMPIDTSSLSAGMYLLKIESQTNTSSYKIIKK